MLTPGLSAEQLGAYMEGNLSPHEAAHVKSLIDNDPSLQQLYDDITSPISWSDDIYDDFPDFDATFVMPEVEGLPSAADSPAVAAEPAQSLDDPAVDEATDDYDVADADEEIDHGADVYEADAAAGPADDAAAFADDEATDPLSLTDFGEVSF